MHPQQKSHVIRLADLVEMTSISRSSVYEAMNPRSHRFDPSFPQKVRLGLRSVGWIEAEVKAWLEGRKVQHTHTGV